MSGDLGFGGGIYGTFLYQQVICDVDLDCMLHAGINQKKTYQRKTVVAVRDDNILLFICVRVIHSYARILCHDRKCHPRMKTDALNLIFTVDVKLMNP